MVVVHYPSVYKEVNSIPYQVYSHPVTVVTKPILIGVFMPQGDSSHSDIPSVFLLNLFQRFFGRFSSYMLQNLHFFLVSRTAKLKVV